MRIDPDWIETSRPDDIQIALLAAECRRLQAVIASTEPTLTDEEREAVEWCIEMATIHATDCDDELTTLRTLLERTK